MRLRPDVHEDWKGNPYYGIFKEMLKSLTPSQILTKINGAGRDEGIHHALEKECERIGIPVDDVRHYWHKGKHFSIFSKNKGVPTYEEIRDDLIAEMSVYAPQYPEIKREALNDPHCLVVDPADIHIGKIASVTETGEEYNSQIAVQRALEGVKGILNKSSSWNIDKIVFVAGNDILHTDTPGKTTTSGTGQDVDGMWYDHFTIARKLNVDIIELLLSVADVHVMFCPSNHDFLSGFFLMDSVRSWFRKCDNITFDADISHRKYFAYGENLIGTTHGDGAKPAALPMLMAQETGENWLKKHRYIYTHHVHHKSSKDYGSVNVESLRSPTGADGWHSRKGFQHAPKAVEGFIHHPEFGQVARLTHIF